MGLSDETRSFLSQNIIQLKKLINSSAYHRLEGKMRSKKISENPEAGA